MFTLKKFLVAWAGGIAFASAAFANGGVIDIRSGMASTKQSQRIYLYDHKKWEPKSHGVFWYFPSEERAQALIQRIYSFDKKWQGRYLDEKFSQYFYSGLRREQSKQLQFERDNRADDKNTALVLKAPVESWQTDSVTRHPLSQVDTPKGLLAFIGGFALFFLRRFSKNKAHL